MDCRKLIALLFLCSPLLAEGPLFKHSDKYVDQEFKNAYNDIRGRLSSKVIQYKSYTTTTQTTTTSSTPQATNLTGSITPRSASNHILVFISGGTESADTGTSAILRITGSSSLGSSGVVGSMNQVNSAVVRRIMSGFVYDDFPASTSAQTYLVKLSSSNNVNSVSFITGNGETATMILVEVTP